MRATPECPKCQGTLTLEAFAAEEKFLAWRCFNCGAIIDNTICRNRRLSVLNQRPVIKRRPTVCGYTSR